MGYRPLTPEEKHLYVTFYVSLESVRVPLEKVSSVGAPTCGRGSPLRWALHLHPE